MSEATDNLQALIRAQRKRLIAYGNVVLHLRNLIAAVRRAHENGGCYWTTDFHECKSELCLEAMQAERSLFLLGENWQPKAKGKGFGQGDSQ